ncbi:MAG: LysM peptidoglycan-binding domain-containing protein, partial [Verrucomicrobiota bacterium]|nr:LysM peptidoglycan-binding domain-containing protein [Verrucomicrobiota bacterium]
IISEPLTSAQPLSNPKIVSPKEMQTIPAPISAPLAESKTAAPPPAATVLRLYTVKSNDTVTTICKHYGIKLSQLLAANPAVDARRLRIGQTLTIPAP